MKRPASGSVGQALTPLTPEGSVEVAGESYPARSERGEIAAGRQVVVTGFDPRCLFVREFVPEPAREAAQPPRPDHPLPAATAARSNPAQALPNATVAAQETNPFADLNVSGSQRIGPSAGSERSGGESPRGCFIAILVGYLAFTTVLVVGGGVQGLGFAVTLASVFLFAFMRDKQGSGEGSVSLTLISVAAFFIGVLLMVWDFSWKRGEKPLSPAEHEQRIREFRATRERDRDFEVMIRNDPRKRRAREALEKAIKSKDPEAIRKAREEWSRAWNEVASPDELKKLRYGK
jgi:hypothetical protein